MGVCHLSPSTLDVGAPKWVPSIEHKIGTRLWHMVSLNWHTVPAHGCVVHFLAPDIREKVYLERELFAGLL